MRDILTKSQGSNNPINVVQATIKGLQMMRDPRETISLRRMVRGEAPLPEAQPEPAANGASSAPATAEQPVSRDASGDSRTPEDAGGPDAATVSSDSGEATTQPPEAEATPQADGADSEGAGT